MDDIPRDFRRKPPADLIAISRVEFHAGFAFPEAYKFFLLQTNGGEGAIGGAAFVMLWPVQDLIEPNEGYKVAEYAPGLFFIGSDGDGEALAFDLRAEELPVVFVPFVGMDVV